MTLPTTLGVCAAGYLLAAAAGVTVEPDSRPFEYLTRALLAVGLYGAVAGIPIGELRDNRGLVVRAVTVGVVAKWLLIGGAFWLYLRHPIAFVLGLAVTQIDPLSVAHLLGNARHPMSARGRAVLAAWSSFDDPVTVLLTLMLLPLLALDSPIPLDGAGGEYAVSLALTAVLVVVAHEVDAAVRRAPALRAVVLGLAMAAAVAMNLMLAPAVLGLVIRLPWERAVARAVTAAFLVATLVLGATFRSGIDPAAGLVLGVAAFAAQAVVAAGLTRGLPTRDRVGLALAQQNGITAVILALWVERAYPGAVGILGPTVVVINLLHGLGMRVQSWGATDRGSR